MKRYTVAQARARLAEVLDAADRGTPVAIERRGVRYVVRVAAAPPRRRRRVSMIETLDPAIDRGNWTWEFGRNELKFRAGRRR